MSGVATAGAIVGGAVIGGVASNMAAGTAADAQTAAANQANATQISMFNKAQANLQPYMTAGNTATTNALNLANTGFNFNDTQAQLEATPGYQFTLNQGLESTQNGAAARGLGVSGASQKAAAAYATGLASNTYQQQFGNALSTYNTNLNANMELSNQGANTISNLNNANTGIAGNINNNYIGQGNAQAAQDAMGGNALIQIGSAAAGGYGNGMGKSSDIRLKDNIKNIGEENGHKIYEFTYKNDDKKIKYIGVMAQDLLEQNPDTDAVIMNDDGFYSIDYDKIGVKFREA